jgi:DNA polymerase IV
MRLPTDIECLYLDFDGFFASVEQQIHPQYRGKPIGVTPFKGAGNRCIIACSKEAKARGISNVISIEEAKAICPELILVPQSPAMYRRAHNALLSEIESVIPISAIKSIDELSCDLDSSERRRPIDVAQQIKAAIRDNIGDQITCSIGFAANRQLAKIACKMDKPNGVTIWHPSDMPAALFKTKFADIPGVGSRMERKLARMGITSVKQLYNTDPKHMRKIWNNVTGERLWYALHGYAIKAPESKRGMFGHGRVLPPDSRTLEAAREVCRFLLIKAARRLRRERFYAAGLNLHLSLKERHWSRSRSLPIVHDDQAILSALAILWEQLLAESGPHERAFKVGVFLYDLSPANVRQLDFLLQDDHDRLKWERINSAVDCLNEKYGKTVASLGFIPKKNLDNVGGKISYTRIPSAEDFW